MKALIVKIKGFENYAILWMPPSRSKKTDDLVHNILLEKFYVKVKSAAYQLFVKINVQANHKLSLKPQQ